MFEGFAVDSDDDGIDLLAAAEPRPTAGREVQPPAALEPEPREAPRPAAREPEPRRPPRRPRRPPPHGARRETGRQAVARRARLVKEKLVTSKIRKGFHTAVRAAYQAVQDFARLRGTRKLHVNQKNVRCEHLGVESFGRHRHDRQVDSDVRRDGEGLSHGLAIEC